MTCGLYPQEGHKDHICIDCIGVWKDCPGCRRGKSCNFKLAMPETLKKRDELFSSKKVRA